MAVQVCWRVECRAKLPVIVEVNAVLLQCLVHVVSELRRD
jgi:hypothetical protein